MLNFAVMENENVTNIIVAESLSIAQSITEKNCIQLDSNADAEPGGKYDFEKNIFIKKQPYPSWTLNDNNQWEPPVQPINNESETLQWDENSLSWVEITI